ncbi:MAG: hypothetical protein ACEY3D_00925 [Rickettsia sp.]
MTLIIGNKLRPNSLYNYFLAKSSFVELSQCHSRESGNLEKATLIDKITI